MSDQAKTSTKEPAYRVAAGQSIMVPVVGSKNKNSRVHLTSGELIPPGSIEQSELESLCGAGLVVRDGDGKTSTRKNKRTVSPGKWNRDPLVLKDKTYDQLCVMIGEIDADEIAPNTKKDCIVLLSRNYNPVVDLAPTAARAATSGPMVQLSAGVVPATGAEREAPENDELDPEDFADTAST